MNAAEYDGAAKLVAMVMAEMEDDGKCLDIITVSEVLRAQKKPMPMAQLANCNTTWERYLMDCINSLSGKASHA